MRSLLPFCCATIYNWRCDVYRSTLATHTVSSRVVTSRRRRPRPQSERQRITDAFDQLLPGYVQDVILLIHELKQSGFSPYTPIRRLAFCPHINKQEFIVCINQPHKHYRIIVLVVVKETRGTVQGAQWIPFPSFRYGKKTGNNENLRRKHVT